MTEPRSPSGPWFVRSVSVGDTHLCSAANLPAPQVAPRCAPDAVFHPLNRRPLESCFFDWQTCPDCLAPVHHPRAIRSLVVTR
ncbi:MULTISPECIES: hypothetical protein [Actinoalloteichus]|uniref:Uncharacterized protein n=1 Tax=Actinoalloteichus fjordicus TaxID=1612552 RepID=A0AAC9LE43_9PSEU|nr:MULTISPECIES: hypothetical protein [Actinoalloteichus]APU15976.1 hypothetical protein UA74_19755 [Actinoalloteichus fjordicus]APU22040.1 hypothetical protein UA75_20255 [Actinoalloteichus sp. GBA129-24]